MACAGSSLAPLLGCCNVTGAREVALDVSYYGFFEAQTGYRNGQEIAFQPPEFNPIARYLETNISSFLVCYCDPLNDTSNPCGQSGTRVIRRRMNQHTGAITEEINDDVPNWQAIRDCSVIYGVGAARFSDRNDTPVRWTTSSYQPVTGELLASSVTELRDPNIVNPAFARAVLNSIPFGSLAHGERDWYEITPGGTLTYIYRENRIVTERTANPYPSARNLFWSWDGFPNGYMTGAQRQVFYQKNHSVLRVSKALVRSNTSTPCCRFTVFYGPVCCEGEILGSFFFHRRVGAQCVEAYSPIGSVGHCNEKFGLYGPDNQSESGFTLRPPELSDIHGSAINYIAPRIAAEPCCGNPFP